MLVGSMPTRAQPSSSPRRRQRAAGSRAARRRAQTATPHRRHAATGRERCDRAMSDTASMASPQIGTGLYRQILLTIPGGRDKNAISYPSAPIIRNFLPLPALLRKSLSPRTLAAPRQQTPRPGLPGHSASAHSPASPPRKAPCGHAYLPTRDAAIRLPVTPPAIRIRLLAVMRIRHRHIQSPPPHASGPCSSRMCISVPARHRPGRCSEFMKHALDADTIYLCRRYHRLLARVRAVRTGRRRTTTC